MQTDRIYLRRWQESDAEALYTYASDPDVGPRAGWPPHQSVAESREVINTFFNNSTTWAIVWKETDEPIGCIGYYTHDSSNISIGENAAGNTAVVGRMKLIEILRSYFKAKYLKNLNILSKVDIHVRVIAYVRLNPV